MEAETILSKYMKATGETIKEVGAGLLAFGDEEMDSLMQQALDKNQKLDFYYASDEDQLADKLSYRFIANQY